MSINDDKFWDLSPLVTKKETPTREAQKISTAEITFSHKGEATQAQSTTVIKRYIDPLHKEHKQLRRESFESTEVYVPDSSLIHSVTLKKRKSQYDLYTDFLRFAIKYKDFSTTEAPYVPYYSYVPQYDQLSKEQMKYYFWWRTCFKNSKLIKVDISYVLLYIYELINLGDKVDSVTTRDTLVKLWNTYHKEFPALSGKLATWICDFCLLHKLNAPTDINASVTASVPSLKEFYINIPRGNMNACADSLLKYGTEYDYHTSKFVTDKTVDLFDKHIFGAVLCAVNFYSRDGVILSELTSEDSKLLRNAFEGALCTTEWRYEIEVKYCSFSRSNELRFIMGDIVKYAENKLRAFLGIKSRLSVYSIGGDLQNALDEYLDNALSREKPVTKKKEEKHEYDALYDLPKRTFSLENAKKIEIDSWDTTNCLVSAFEEINNDPPVDTPMPVSAPEPCAQSIDSNSGDGDLRSSLGKYLEFALSVKAGDMSMASDISRKLGMLPVAVADAINEIAVEIIGDIIIEDNGDIFSIVECYEDML